MKDMLGKFIIAVTGDFDVSTDQIRKWVANNGGKWATAITKATTHLISSKEHFKKGSSLVTAAKAHPNVHIVTYDWLEDSLQARRPKGEKPYLWRRIVKAKQKELNRQKREARKQMMSDALAFEGGCRKAMEDLGTGTSKRKAKSSNTWFTSSLASLADTRAEIASLKAAATTLPTPSPDGQASPIQLFTPTAQPPVQSESTSAASRPPVPSTRRSLPMLGMKTDSQPALAAVRFSDLYALYADPTGFVYDVVLARIDLATNTNSRYHLRLYETNTSPRQYCTVLRFVTPNQAVQKEYIAPVGSSYEVAWRAFREAFRQKTLLAWEERFQSELVRGRMGEGKVPFFYRPPIVGVPRGVVPEVVLMEGKGKGKEVRCGI